MTTRTKWMICLEPIILPALFSLISVFIKWPDYTNSIIALMVVTLGATVVCVLFAIGILMEWITGKMEGQPDWIAASVSLVTVFGILAAYLFLVLAGCGMSSRW